MEALAADTCIQKDHHSRLAGCLQQVHDDSPHLSDNLRHAIECGYRL
jgi:hypothetical protein